MSLELKLSHFDPAQIAASGQCFRWKRISDREYEVPAYGRALHIRGGDGDFSFSCDREEFETVWKEYLGLNDDYDEIEEKIRKFGDEHLLEAFNVGSGIRILKQDLWETIVSFMISQNNNIPRIRGSIEKICALSGKRTSDAAGFAFPGPGDLDLKALLDPALGLGYRAPYLSEMFDYTASDPSWLDELKSMDYEHARKKLISMKGIGPKVADCVCLFGLHHIDAFPIDTHVRQLLDRYYPRGFDSGYFKGCAGVIQQYLFFYEIK